MSGFNNNYFNRHLINDMRNALNSVFIEEEKTSARNLQQSRERLDSDRAERQARGKANNAAKAEQAAARKAAAAAPAAPTAAGATPAAPAAAGAPATPVAAPAAAQRGARAGEINTDSTKWEQLQGRPRSINQDGSFNISQETLDRAQANRNPDPTETPTRQRYVNPNSPEGRVNADVKSGKLPASFGQYQGNRLPMDLAKEREDAGNAAFDTSVKDNLGIKNASGMNRSELDRQTRDAARRNIETELNMAKELNGEGLDKQYPSISTTDPAGVAKVKADRIAAAAVRVADADAEYRLARQTADAKRSADAANTAAKSSPAAPKAATPAPAASSGDQRKFGELSIPGTSNLNAGTKAPAAPAAAPAAPAASSGDQRKFGELSIPGTSNLNAGTKAPAAPTAPTAPTAAEQQQRFDNWDSGKSGNPKGTPNDSVSRQVGYDVESSRNRTSEALRQSQRAEELVNKSKESKKVVESNLSMWNGTIGPNGGQRAKPAGSPKPTLKVENTVKPKTPPQTFFPMR